MWIDISLSQQRLGWSPAFALSEVHTSRVSLTHDTPSTLQ
jgi:hypothetical protein